PSRLGVHDKRALEQVYQLLADLDVQPRIRVLEHDVLLGLQQRLGVQRAADARLGQRVDVGPLAGTRAAGGRVPFLAQGLGERFVGDEGEQGGDAGGVVGPGVLGVQDVG
ncbi:MAG: hypothetical protein LQ340_004257, partial [Diploschistes diacapsis]